MAANDNSLAFALYFGRNKKPPVFHEWFVWNRFGDLLGTVQAPRKFMARFLAERDLKAIPGQFYIGRA